MKYIILASLLSSAAIAAPFAQQQQAAGNTNANAGQATQQTQQVGQQQQAGVNGQIPAGQQQQQGVQGVNGQAGQVQNGQQGVQNGQIQNGQQQQGVQNVPTGGAGTQGTPSDADLATAVSNWMADTSMVSNFLNMGPTITNNVAFKQAATVAFNAEVDELNHKAIIDAANGNDPNVIAANSTLATGGAFQDVVDKLQIMSQQGLAAANNIDLINQNRCTNVLPNIDAYMASTGSASQAVRPDVCDQTGVAGGVQSAGRTLPGGAPGTPQQAFDAAAALANGSGNGIVANAQQQIQGGQQQQAGQQIQQGQQQAGQQIQQGQQQAGQQVQQGQAQAQQGQVQQDQAQQGQVAQGQQVQAQQGQQAAAAAQQQQQAGAGAAGVATQ